MTERELNLRYGEARADYGRAPSYFNAQAVQAICYAFVFED